MLSNGRGILKQVPELDTRTKIAFLSGDEVIDFKVLYCLYRAYPNVHIICNDEKSLIKYSRYKKSFTYIPWSASREGQDDIAFQIKTYCDDNKIDVVVTGGSDSVYFLHKYRDLFENQKLFPTADEQTIENTDNKWIFAEYLTEMNITTPYTILIDSFDVVADSNKLMFEEKIGYPMIVKPVHGHGGLGVSLIHDFEHLKDHLSGSYPYNDLPLIAQEYVEGYDIDYSVIARDGKVISYAVQRWIDEDTLEFCEHELVEKIGEQIVEAFNYSGPGHLDMRIEKGTGKLTVLECNPRFWRSVTAAMWTGLNFVEAGVNATLGKEYQRQGASGHYVMPGKKIKTVVRKPWTYFSLSKSDREDIWFNLTDPMPQIMARFGDGFGA